LPLDWTIGASKGDENASLTTCHAMCHIGCMPSVNIRQLRDTRRLKAWLRSGKTVELRERDQVIARIVPEKQQQSQVQWPDFEVLAKEIIGDRVLPGADLLIEERGRY
jgi:antitoxin (DNA-binding transcriptional repressor) of toxin-antitoxin stability system